jgi:hypothetical protein
MPNSALGAQIMSLNQEKMAMLQLAVSGQPRRYIHEVCSEGSRGGTLRLASVRRVDGVMM